MRTEIKKLIEAVKNHPYLTIPTPGAREFEDLWQRLMGRFRTLSYNEAALLPWDSDVRWIKERPGTSKAELILREMTHDINQTFLYYPYYYDEEGWTEPGFNFTEFWKRTLLPVIEMIEKYIDGKDSEIPVSQTFLVYRKDSLQEKMVEVYQPTGTPWWRLAHYITSEEEGKERLAKDLSELEETKKDMEKYIENWGPITEDHYYHRIIKRLESEIDLLTGKISNDESSYLVKASIP